MKPVSRGLLLGMLATIAAVSCVHSSAQTPSGKTRSTGTVHSWATARGGDASSAPFRGATFRELAIPSRDTPHIAFSTDSKKVAVGSGMFVYVWITESGKPLAKINLPGAAVKFLLAFTADGSSVGTHLNMDKVVRFWDATTGEKGKDWSFEDASGVVALAPNADRVLARGRLSLKAHPVYEKGKEQAVATIEPRDAGLDAEFAPDHASVALRSASGRVRLVNLTTGKTTWDVTMSWSPSGSPVLTFSPAGKFLLVSVGQGTQRQVAVLGAADGKEWCRLPLEGRSVVMSADGRIVLASVNGALRMFDLWTEREVVGYVPPNGSCTAVAASPDGKTLAVVGYATNDLRSQTVYLTEFPSLPVPLNTKTDLSADEEAEYWSGLTGMNLFRRKHAEDVFLARPDQTLVIVARRLTPVPDIERMRAEDLVQNLSDPDPAFRARVAEELDRCAVRFQPLLAAAHEKSTGDAKVKLAAVLKKAANESAATATAEQRGLELLERLATQGAKTHIGKLAAGAKGARLTEAATAALERLATKTKE